MNLIFKIFFFSFFVLTLSANENEIDSLSLLKVKKLVEKEEQLAFAYKKNILEKGVQTNSISTLKTNTYLPKGFDEKNSFGKVMQLSINTGTPCLSSMTESECKKDDKHQIGSFLPNDIKVKSNLYDYYYSNSNRKYTKAPLGLNNNNVEIVLSSKEKFIYQNALQITTNFASKNNQYYLDTKGVLHYYDNTGKYKFSYDKELLVDENVNMLDIVGNKTAEFTALMANKNILYSGQTIIQKKGETASDYVNLGDKIIEIGTKAKEIGKTVIQFSRRSGGMIVNGDIYAWGNNSNRITTIDKDEYTVANGVAGTKSPVITTLFPIRARIYDVGKYQQVTNDSTNRAECLSPIGSGNVNCKYSTTNCDNPTGAGTLLCKDVSVNYNENNYFSSPNRPKFVDFFSTVYHGTCGVSIKGELYCAGKTANNQNYLYTQVDTGTQTNPPEMLYRSIYFNGTENRKATKVFANNYVWLILANTKVDNDGSYMDGKIYRWGVDQQGFSGNGAESTYNNKNDPTELVVMDNSVKVSFKDITYLLTIGYRKMAALSNDGDVYIWGLDNKTGCTQSISSKTINLCAPYKIPSTVSFSEIKGGLNAFVAKGNDGKYYKISQKWGEFPKIELVNDKIKNDYGTQYVDVDDVNLLSVDFTSTGIVWVNTKNELKGDFFTAQNGNDALFRDSIKKIKWKKIKVIEDDNGMCGIDIYNQMYCWGMQSFFQGSAEGNTYMIPVFNTNLYDSNKDYLVVEGGSSNVLTNMTSNEWTISTDSTKPFFMKYPTYIGGFNYEFIFK